MPVLEERNFIFYCVMATSEDIQKITREIQRAYEANEKGKYGLARVCARRAAGWAIQKHLELKGISLYTPSVLDHIAYLLMESNTKPAVKKILNHMMQKVEKTSLEGESTWPLPEVNLVEEAHWLVEELLGISIDLENSKLN
jgi:hypothetical protein